jgi:hypothetical protein
LILPVHPAVITLPTMRLILLPFLLLAASVRAEFTSEQHQVPLEVLPTDATKAKVVLIAGTPTSPASTNTSPVAPC